jgi:prevent-host-death family protein
MQLTVTEARKRWSELLDRVERGETISVSRRGKVVATFVPERALVPAPAKGSEPETGRAV